MRNTFVTLRSKPFDTAYQRRVDEYSVKEALADYTRRFIERGEAFGEIGTITTPEINLAGISHSIVFAHYDTKTQTIVAGLKILDTPQGRILKQLCEGGSEEDLYLAVRATGHVEGLFFVDEVITFDVGVFDPVAT